MRLHSAYLNRQAAKDVNSIFETEHYVKKIYKEGDSLWELTKKEQQDDAELEEAEKDSEIQDIIREEKEEIKDIEDLANQTFKVIRDGVLLIHTQLDQLKSLMKEDEVLEASGFPIEVADQLEEMLQHEIKSITLHLRKMGTNMESKDGIKKNSENH